MARWKRKGAGPTIYASVEVTTDVEAEIEIADLDDDELQNCIEEARKRGLLGTQPKPRRERMALVYEDLVAGRTGRALADFEDAFFSEEDARLRECWRALQEGRWSAAICHLDGEVFVPKPRKSAYGTMTAPTPDQPSTDA